MSIVMSSHKGQTIMCRQYHIVIENSNHSLYTENTWYEEHIIHIPAKAILLKIIYPIPDEHIAVILCTLNVLYISKCKIKCIM